MDQLGTCLPLVQQPFVVIVLQSVKVILSERKNQHTGTNEIFDPTNKVFFSPIIKYCDYKGVYMSEHPSKGKKYRFALQLRLQPDTYQTGQETVNASVRTD